MTGTVVTEFTTELPQWRPYLTPVALADASAEQLEALKVTPSNTKVSDYVLVLAHDPESLTHRTPVFNAIMYDRGGLSRAEREIGAIGASVVNHCVYCTAVHVNRYTMLAKRPEVIDEIFANGEKAVLDERLQAIFDFSVKLSKSPSQATEDDVRRLRDLGLSDLEILDLTLATAIFGWANRLMHTLGEPVRP
jgi:uncharacterized peroxidase-related enzyme